MSSFLSSSSSSMPDNDLEMREKERCSRSYCQSVDRGSVMAVSLSLLSAMDKEMNAASKPIMIHGQTRTRLQPMDTSTKERTRKIMVEVGLSLNVLSVAGRVAVC